MRLALRYIITREYQENTPPVFSSAFRLRPEERLLMGLEGFGKQIPQGFGDHGFDVRIEGVQSAGEAADAHAHNPPDIETGFLEAFNHSQMGNPPRSASPERKCNRFLNHGAFSRRAAGVSRLITRERFVVHLVLNFE